MTPEHPAEPDPDQTAAAAFLLRFSARPLILAGAGAAGSVAELVRLAESVGAPVLTTEHGRDSFPPDHPLAAGSFPGSPGTLRLAAESDMVIAVGTSFEAAEAAGKPELPAQMVHIDRDLGQIDRVYPVRNGIVGDARTALGLILDELKRSPAVAALADARAAQAPQRAARARREGAES